jgi:DNA-binding transcriptional LysR family regulator
MNITLRQLQIFEKVATLQHVTKASEELYLSQSAVSMAIADLERLVDAPLFERIGKRLLLNDRGRMVLSQVSDVLKRAEAIELFLTDSAGEPMGELTVGASTTIGNYLLPKIAGNFSKKYPKAKALLYVGNTQQVETAVEHGEYDLGLIEGPSHNPSLTVSPWRSDELVVIAGCQHPLAKRKKVTKEMLSEADWIIREKGSGTREVFEEAMKANDISYSINMELGHTEAIKKAVEAGLGIGCLSRMAVQRELENGWLCEVKTPLDLRRTLFIITRGAEYRTKLFEAYITLLSSYGNS